MVTRRETMAGLGGLAGLAALAAAGLPGRALAQADSGASWQVDAPRARVIIDNDFSGDPDDLFQTAHHLLSPSVDIRLIIGSHLGVKDAFDPSARQAANAVARLRELVEVMDMTEAVGGRILQGAETAITDRTALPSSPATQAIIAEALRDDTDLPLYYCAGGGLTEIALAWLAEPRIAERLVLVWIGGPEYPDLAAPPPDSSGPEYNLAIDLEASRIVFGESDLPLWQVPRDAYRQMLVSHAEMLERVAPQGPLGAYLVDRIAGVARLAGGAGIDIGETYILGDSPLVTLTALQSSFQPDPSSSRHVEVKAPRIDAAGAYEPNKDGRPIRVFTAIDARLTFGDFFAKLALRERS